MMQEEQTIIPNRTIDNVVAYLLQQFDTKAVIFDLDGTLVDNNAWHLKTWKIYLQNLGLTISEEAYRKNINGRTNKDALEYIYNRKLSDEEAMAYALKKEALYREIYKPNIKPVEGLLNLLEAFHKQGIPMAIATSGIPVNIEFMFEHIPIRQYFSVIINSTHIKKGKPDPEIYLKTATSLGIQADQCLVFEDAVVGVNAARSAGMKVVAITTTQSKEELKDADLLITDFTAPSFYAGIS